MKTRRAVKTLLLFIFGFLANAEAAPGSFRCVLQELSNKEAKPVSFQLTTAWKRTLDSGDTVGLRIQGQKRTLSFTEPFEAGVRGTILQEITCSGRGNCKAIRVQHASGKSRKVKHLTRSLASGDQTLIGAREVFTYSAQQERFQFRYVRYRTLEKQDIGHEVRCER